VVLSSLTEWYLDIETDGPDPRTNRILTIQYQRLVRGEPEGVFQVLAEWEWGEKQIVRTIVERRLLEPTSEFVPVGTGLKDHIAFIIEKAERYGVKEFSIEELQRYWVQKPIIDLALADSGGGVSSGSAARREQVVKLYREGRYDDLIDLVTREKEEALPLIRETTHSRGVLSRPDWTVAP